MTVKSLLAQHNLGTYSAVNDASGGSQYFGPRSYAMDGTARSGLFAHGTGGDEFVSYGVSQSANLAAIMREVASTYPMLAARFAGDSWGNDTGILTVGDAWTYHKATFGAKTDKVFLFGHSMGHAVVCNWARQNKALVAGIIGFHPVSDLNDMVTNNRGGTAAGINTAYGTYNEATHGPTHNPVDYAAADLAGIPWLGFSASDDVVVVPSTVTALAAAIGGSATMVNLGAVGGHTDTALGFVNIQTVLDFLAAHS